MARGLFLGVLELLPGSLARRLPILVVVSYLLGALISGWTVYTLAKRSGALNEAFVTGQILADTILEASAGGAPRVDRVVGPYRLEKYEALRAPLPEHTVPLILELEGQRLRAAIAFDEPAKLPDALRAQSATGSAAERMADLSRGITRQDQFAQLHIFAGPDAVLTISAPGLWHPRLSQTVVALIGLIAFTLCLSLTVPIAMNLAAPFVRLAARGEDQNEDVLPSSEAITIQDKISRQTDRFLVEQERKARGLASVSHDLRTPVTRLRLRTELLEDDALRDKFEADLDDVSGIIDGALDLLSLRASPEQSYDFSLVDLLESLVNDYRDVGRDIEFDASGEIELKSAGSVFAPSAEVTVKAANTCLMRGQPDKLRRAFSNVFDNALKYGGRAIVTVKPDKTDMLQVNIRDFGPGIDAEQMDRVMLPFVRGRAPRSSAGVGLGLSIASELIELHGGTIELTNQDPGLLVTARVARGFAV